MDGRLPTACKSSPKRITATSIAIGILAALACLARFPGTASLEKNNRIHQIPQVFAPYIQFANGRPGVIASYNDYPLTLSKDRCHDLVNSYLLGLGEENRIYLPDHQMTRQLQDAYHVAKARSFFYDKYKHAYGNGAALKGASVTCYDGYFTIIPFILAGTDLVEQFVGSYKLDMQVDSSGKQVLFILKNTTGNESAFFHLPFVHDIYRKPGVRTRGGNLNQVYIWQEPLAQVMEAGATGTPAYLRGLKDVFIALIAIFFLLACLRIERNRFAHLFPLRIAPECRKQWCFSMFIRSINNCLNRIQINVITHRPFIRDPEFCFQSSA
jgi:hypothetical protein